MITCTSIKQLNEVVKNNIYKKIKVELKVNKDVAKKYFNPKELGAFEKLYSGKIYITYKNGELESYQFGKGIDY